MIIAVIGGGAAGLTAAGAAGERIDKSVDKVLLLEKNSKLGKKLYITGKGRCNVTNSCASAATVTEGFMRNVVSNPKFLFGAVSNFSPADAFGFFESRGCLLKTERGGRVFPASDKASDIIRVLRNYADGAEIVTDTAVSSIVPFENGYALKTENGREYRADRVIIATGGLSYPATGSTGDGYAFARALGHNVVKPVPALVPIKIREEFVKRVEGLSLKNVTLSAFYGGKPLCAQFGEMLFTGDGISGPIALQTSSLINRLDLSRVKLSVDLKPALSAAEADARLLRDFGGARNKMFKNSLAELLPKSLIPVIIELSRVPPELPCNRLTAQARRGLAALLKNLELTPAALYPVEDGIVTAGGVDVKEINPKTMESKIRAGLFFCGEVLDVDAFTGGYNIQSALSTGYTAGVNAAARKIGF